MFEPLAAADLADELALLDAEPAPCRPRRAPAWGAELRAVPDLPPQPCLAGILADIPEQPSELLLRRIGMEHTTAAVLWALHAELDARGIPPCVRPEQQIGTEQARFVTVLADLLWLAKRHPGHRTLTRRSRGVLHDPGTPTWHKSALWLYQSALGQPYLLAKWLALTPEQRLLTATMPTRDQATRRAALPDQLTKVHNKLLEHARAHPDRSGATEPTELAKRRTELLRVFLLLDRDRKRTHRYMQEVRGFKSTVNALNLQLQTIAAITGSQRLVMGSGKRVRRFLDPACSSFGRTR